MRLLWHHHLGQEIPRQADDMLCVPGLTFTWFASSNRCAPVIAICPLTASPTETERPSIGRPSRHVHFGKPVDPLK
jgi:hypothetical protein